MEEETIKRAAEDAVSDLELDCEVREVCRSPGGDEWCVQFDGSYSQFCDEFQDQFEQDNSPVVVREKIKRHLLKQVDKLRRSTGKTRRPRAKPADDDLSESKIFAAPVKMIGDVLDGAQGLAGSIVQRVTDVAEAARRTVVNMSDEIPPAAPKGRDSSSARKETSQKSSTPRARKAKKAPTGRVAKSTRKVSTGASRKVKKAGKAAAKSGSKAGKRGTKKTKRKARP